MKAKVSKKSRAPASGSRPLVGCPCCSGKGRVPLSDELWQTLKRVRESINPCITDQLVERGITRNAINNRLDDLESLGLVKCTGKHGKWRIWKAVNAERSRSDQRQETMQSE